jgi:hypothetical protein
MGDYIPAAQVVLETAFVLTVLMKTVQEAQDVQRKRLEIKREKQKLEEEKKAA